MLDVPDIPDGELLVISFNLLLLADACIAGQPNLKL
jgi:hypothetical protein